MIRNKYHRDYYLKNADKVREKVKAWREANADHYRSYQAAYRQKARELRDRMQEGAHINYSNKFKGFM